MELHGYSNRPMPGVGSYREYSGFPGCSDRGDSSALSGVMATITSIALIVHIGTKLSKLLKHLKRRRDMLLSPNISAFVLFLCFSSPRFYKAITSSTIVSIHMSALVIV